MATTLLATDLLKASGLTGAKIQRTVHQIVQSGHSSMGTMQLTNVFHGDFQNYVSPFFLFDEFGPMSLAPNAPFRVDAHPHAGIVPTTYLLEGSAHHRDSMGNDFEYHQGDFIHFTSGKGALHMEETGSALRAEGGRFHGIQSWLNMPPKWKQADPYSGHLKSSDMEVIQTENARIKVVLGSVFGKKSKLELLFPVFYYHITMEENGILELPVETTQNVFVYLLNGQLELESARLAGKGQLVLYERNGDYIRLKSKTASEFLVLGGEVNNEPYVAHGPFVLNNEQEIRQAYLDYQAGKFGDTNQTNGVVTTSN